MVAANGIYKLSVIGTVSGQQHVHTLHFRSTASGNSVGLTEPAWMQDLLTTFQAGPQGSYLQMFGGADTPISLFQVRKVCGSEPLPAGLDAAPAGGAKLGTGIAGEFNGDKHAPWIAGVVTVRSALSGRNYRGRFFIGGMYEAMSNGSTLSTARITALTTYSAALNTAYVAPLETAKNAALFVYSHTLSKKDPKPACQDTGADVVSFQVRDQLATMKSRKAGSGI
jgi:hypothetical protein